MPEPDNFQFAREGQPEANPQEAVSTETTKTPGGSQAEPKFVTYEELQKLLGETESRIVKRASQSTQDRIKNEMARLQKAGINATPEQVEKIIDADPQPPASQTQTSARTPGQVSTQDTAEVHPIVALAQKYIKKAGIDDIVENEPEYKMIDQTTTDETVFIDSIKAAAAAKAERLRRAGSPARMPTLGTGGGRANNISNITDTDELWKATPFGKR